MNKKRKGLLQIYTGDGKGKTTASLGLGLRAVGQGLTVLMVQFLKSPTLSSGEYKIAEKFGNEFKIQRLSTPWWTLKSFKNDDHKAKITKVIACELIAIHETIQKEPVDVLILDEMNICLHYGFVTCIQLETFIQALPSETEVILTGRNAPKEIINKADLVTEMVMHKHPYSEGVKARRGIEF